jgi:PAS domain S-box-containing protein
VAARKIAGIRLLRLLPAGITLLALGVIGWVVWQEWWGFSDRTYRIGFENDPPYDYIGPDGRPAGLALDVISEAARRAGIKLQWVFCPESSEAAMGSGKVDLWPLMTDLPERRKTIYFSDAWLQSDLYLVSRDPAVRVGSEFAGTLGHIVLPLIRTLRSQRFPKARPVEIPTVQGVMTAACRGEIDAGMLSLSDIRSSLNLGAEGCSIGRFNMQPIPGLSLRQGVAALPRFRGVADRLRREIDKMAREHALTEFFSKHSLTALDDFIETYELLEIRSRSRWLTMGIVATGLALVATLFLCFSLHRAKKELASANSVKDEFISRYEPAARATNDVIWDWDLKTGRLAWSSALATLFGYPEEETGAAMAWREEHIHPDDRDRVIEGMRTALERKQPSWAAEYRFRKKDGGYALVVDRVCVQHDEKGNPVRVTGAMQDDTLRRHLEEQLRQAQKMEALGALAGGIAHDFNNLITVINGYCDLMLSGMLRDDALRTPITEIRGAGERASGLVRQLSSFSRRQTMQRRVINLNQVIEEVSVMLRRLVGEDIGVVFRLDPSLRNVTADLGQMNQVILNLAVNARDAMPRGGKLELATSNLQLREVRPEFPNPVPPGDYVLLEVGDTGTGMDETTLRHVFEPFFTTKDAGTGLGLYTVHGIVRQSRGHVAVESAPSAGTRFRIYLPPVERGLDTPRENVQERRASIGSRTILLVEDQEEVRVLTATVLKQGGYEVLEAADAEQALKLNRGHNGTIHLLVTDLIMPGMNGRELAEAVARGRPGIAVLFMTGYSEEVISEKGASHLGGEVIRKPFTPQQLTSCIAGLLGGRPV